MTVQEAESSYLMWATIGTWTLSSPSYKDENLPFLGSQELLASQGKPHILNGSLIAEVERPTRYAFFGHVQECNDAISHSWNESLIFANIRELRRAIHNQ